MVLPVTFSTVSGSLRISISRAKRRASLMRSPSLLANSRPSRIMMNTYDLGIYLLLRLTERLLSMGLTALKNTRVMMREYMPWI